MIGCLLMYNNYDLVQTVVRSGGIIACHLNSVSSAVYLLMVDRSQVQLVDRFKVQLVRIGDPVSYKIHTQT